MGLNKFNNLKVKSGAESSRFVIDLKQNSTVAETVVNKNVITESKLEKLAELDYGKILKTGSEKAKKNFTAYAKTVCNRNFWILALVRLSSPQAAGTHPNGLSSGRMTKGGKWIPGSAVAEALADKQARNEGKSEKIWRELDQLAFFALAKLFFIVLKRAITLVYKICYGAGWVIVFCLRLVFFVLLAIAKPIIKSLSFMAGRFKPIISRSRSMLSKSFKTTRAAASAVAAKGLPTGQAGAKRLKRNIVEEEIIPPPTSQARRCGRGLTPLYPADASTDAKDLADKEALAGRQGGIAGYLKPVLVFAGVLLIMVLPVKGWTYYKTVDSAKGKVLGASESAMNNLISGGQAAANLDFNRADESFTRAGNNFLVAENQLKEINGLLFTLGSIVPDKNIQLAAAGKHLVRAGGLSAAAGKNLSLAVESLFNYQASSSQDLLLNLSVYGHQAIINLTDLDKELEQINSEAIPAEYQKNFILLKQKIGELSRGLNEFIGLTDKIESFLGGEAAKRYLLIFQNNSELRASGGFIGSFAIMDFLNGEIKKLEAPGGGSYDTDAGLLKKIKSPEPLSLVRADWHFWDANWWPDWATSARKLAWFYENSDGSTVDGVISFTPTVMENILRVIGPIDLKEKYGVIIDADNFWPVTQAFAEQKPDVTKQPKKIIGDLMNKIIEELPKRLNKDNLIPLLKTVEELLSDKNILFYFTDSELQAKVEALGWTGKIKATTGDYLSVINTNIAGGKSDRKIDQAIIHQAEVQPDGTVIDNLTIKRTHQAVRGEPFSGVRNVDWLRIYVPLGSELIEASGFRPVDKIFFKEVDPSWQNDPEVFAAESQVKTEAASGTKIYNELGKTVFANWTQVDPGETIEIKIKYQLPFKITDKKFKLEQGLLDQFIARTNEIINPEQKDLYSYSLLTQKQPGMNSSTIESELKLSDNFQPIWQFPADLNSDQSGWSRTENLDQDKIMAVMLEEK